MRSFEFQVLSPERKFYEDPCVSLIVPITDGMLGIQAGHTPMTAAIRDGEVVMTLPDGKKRSIAVTRGFLDVSSENVRLICESALSPDEIDVAAEQRALEEAQEQMREAKARRDYLLTEIAIAKALNNLKVKNHNAEELMK